LHPESTLWLRLDSAFSTLSMRSIKRAKLGLALNILTWAIAPMVAAAVPAPGDVVVEINLDPSSRRSQPSLQQPMQIRSLPRGGSNLPAPIPSSPSRHLSFNSQQLDRQLQLYTHYLSQVGKPDILIVGSSRALQGVDPISLQQALAKRGYPNLKIFNFGINGATAQVVDWLLRQLLTPEQLPRLIVWADGVRAFNSGRIDQTFNNIRSSQGYQALNQGMRPPIPTISGLEVGQICMDALPLPLPSSLKSISDFPQKRPLSGVKDDLCHQAAKVTIRSGVSAPSPLMPSMTALETLGFQIVNTQFDPDRYFQRFPRVPGYYDADYRRFTLYGRQINALERVVTFANQRQIPLVFVNLPLTQTYLDGARFAYEDQFRRQMQRLAYSRGFRFQDLGLQSGLDSNRYFADPSHLNRHGAAVVSKQISADLARSLTGLMQSESKTDSIETRTSSLIRLWIPLARGIHHRSTTEYPNRHAKI
jgi:hypothetical protein